MPLPIDARKRPSGVKVHVSTGEGVEVTWSDGHVSRYDFPYLRDHCPCATCNDERLKKEENPAKAAASEVFPMFKPKAKAKAATAVGNYAIQIEFTDGHATGIYSFDHLREICPCEACAREFRPAAKEKTA
jgi:DUF971 family protein